MNYDGFLHHAKTRAQHERDIFTSGLVVGGLVTALLVLVGVVV